LGGFSEEAVAADANSGDTSVGFILLVLNYVNSVALLENPVNGGQYKAVAFVGSIQYSVVPVLVSYQPSSGFLPPGNLQQYYSISV
jgi:hypothetical protein